APAIGGDSTPKPDFRAGVRVWVPGGVPPLPPPEPPPPPQAAWKTAPATSTDPNSTLSSLAFRSRGALMMIPADVSPAIGSHSALNNGLALPDHAVCAPVGAVVVIVAVAELPGVIELGLTEHWGACAADGCTVQVKETVSPNPLVPSTFTVAVADWPELIGLG